LRRRMPCRKESDAMEKVLQLQKQCTSLAQEHSAAQTASAAATAESHRAAMALETSNVDLERRLNDAVQQVDSRERELEVMVSQLEEESRRAAHAEGVAREAIARAQKAGMDAATKEDSVGRLQLANQELSQRCVVCLTATHLGIIHFDTCLSLSPA
jgi:hypothetical protein